MVTVRFLIKSIPHFLFFFTLPIIFITSYVYTYQYPASIILDHLIIITPLILAVLTLKLLLNRLFQKRRLNIFLMAHLYSITFLFISGYYAIVSIGLTLWGRVITEEFIVSYSRQMPTFLSVLDIPIFLVASLVLTIYTITTTACYFFTKKFSWHLNDIKIQPLLLNTLLISIILLFPHIFHLLLSIKEISQKNNNLEPIRLTMLSGKRKKQNHNANLRITPSLKINQLENKARKEYKTNKNANRKNLVVFMVDGLRPDHMSIYGYERDTTPYLKQLQRQRDLKIFNQVHSTCSETSCAHASFMGSRFLHKLPDKLFTLQEVLNRHQYTTNFIISGDHINFYNIRDIYGDVDHYFDGSMQDKYFFNDDRLIIDKTKELPDWNGEPQMIYYHLLSNHTVGTRHDKFSRFKPAATYTKLRLNQLISEKSFRRQMMNNYDNGIIQTDFIIKELIRILMKKNYLENTLVVITSDHGEGFGEHGLYLHTNSVYEEALKIPLILIPYGYESEIEQANNRFFSIVDLAPTILKEFDIPIPANWVGKPVHERVTQKFSFFKMRSFNGFYDIGTDNIWKYWQDQNSLEEFVFDISKDPGEKNNLYLTAPKKKLTQWRSMLKDFSR